MHQPGNRPDPASGAPLPYDPSFETGSAGDATQDFVLVDGPVFLAPSVRQFDLSGTPDGLRDAVRTHFASHGGEWELRVQLCTGLEKMPIEDASVEWPEADSPWVAVARLRTACRLSRRAMPVQSKH